MTMSEYLKKYPWLKVYDPYSEDESEVDCCVLDWLPHGWVKAFGELLCEDLDRVIKAENLQDEFRIDEAKEKYGQVRIYCHPCTPAIQDVLRAYETYSEVTCCHCGSIEEVKFVPFGWVSPYCRNCWKTIDKGRNLERFDALPNQELPDALKWARYSKNGTEHFEMDISEITQKIRERYAKRKANGEFDNDDFEEWENNYYGA